MACLKSEPGILADFRQGKDEIEHSDLQFGQQLSICRKRML